MDGKKWGKKENKRFYKKKGSTVNINLKIKPGTQSVKIGYLDKDQIKHYKTVKAKIDYDFTIKKQDIYRYLLKITAERQ